MLRFSISASADNARNTASNVPSSRHLANRAYTDCHGPYTSGSSRHCAPLWAIQSIPLSIFRSSFRGRPRCPVLSGGSIAFTRSHCSFVNSYRFMYLFSHLHTTCAIFIFQTTPSIPLRIPVAQHFFAQRAGAVRGNRMGRTKPVRCFSRVLFAAFPAGLPQRGRTIRFPGKTRLPPGRAAALRRRCLHGGSLFCAVRTILPQG